MSLEFLLLLGEQRVDGDGLLHLMQLSRSTLIPDPNLTVTLTQLAKQYCYKDTSLNKVTLNQISKQIASKDSSFNTVTLTQASVQALYLED